MRRVLGLAPGFALALVLGASGSARSQLVTAAPPPGFDDLREPQPAVVDVWFDGVPVGVADALVQPGALRFDDPDAVTALLPGTIDRTAVAAALAGDLAANAERVCTDVPDPDCGLLEPSVAGIVFDIATFRADVFVAPAYRAAGGEQAVFLTPPDWSPSGVQSFSVAASLAFDEDVTGVVGGRSLLATGPLRLVADYGVDADLGYFTDGVVAEGDMGAWRIVAGLDRAAPVPLLGDRRFLGGRIETTLDTRIDRDSIRGSPLVVSLPRRSQVEVLRDGRLLSVQSLPAGTQAVDTTSLPAGSYDVTLRILSTQGVREEQRFFVKNDALPPAGSPQGVVEAGVFTEDEQSAWPARGTTPFLRSGLRYRLFDPLALGADLAVTDEEAVLSLTGFASWRRLETALDGFVSSQGGYGAGFAVRGDVGRFSYTGGVRRILVDNGTDAASELDHLVAVEDDTTQLDLTLDYRFTEGPRIGLRAFWRDERGADATYSVGPSLYWPIGRWSGTQLDLLVDAATSDEETFTFARLRFSFDVDPWRVDGAAGFRTGRDGNTSNGPSASASISRDWRTSPVGRLRASAFVDQEPGATTAGAALAARGGRGRLDVQAEQNLRRGDGRLALNGFTSMVGGSGGVAVGGDRVQDGAFLVALEGEGDATFEVLVDERPYGRVDVGGRLVVPLRPYDSYSVRLRHVAGPLVGYDGRPRHRTLYPGTVATEAWTVAPLVSVFGRLVDHQGTPLADATLLTEPPFATDGAGYFQADLPTGRTRVEATAHGRRCRLRLPVLEPAATYRRLGTIPCDPVDTASSSRP